MEKLTIDNFLSKNECERWVTFIEKQQLEEAPINTGAGEIRMTDVRNNDRLIIDNHDLAEHLFTRSKKHLPEYWNHEELHGLNERFRCYRYQEGQYFNWHRDGIFKRSPYEASRLSFLIYLNSDFEGGETAFEDCVIVPKTGTALVFPHRLRHKGAEVTCGTKYVLRTDVMYMNPLAF